VIMTSNLGSHWMADEALTDSVATIHDRALNTLREHFAPEFLNRVDEVLIFHRLTREHIARILEIQLRSAAKRLVDHKLDLVVTEAARAVLAERGYDPAYGARPLRRTISRLILNPLASRILDHVYQPGDTIVVDAKGGEIVFRESDPLLDGAKGEEPAVKGSEAENNGANGSTRKRKPRKSAEPRVPEPAG